MKKQQTQTPQPTQQPTVADLQAQLAAALAATGAGPAPAQTVTAEADAHYAEISARGMDAVRPALTPQQLAQRDAEEWDQDFDDELPADLELPAPSVSLQEATAEGLASIATALHRSAQRSAALFKLQAFAIGCVLMAMKGKLGVINGNNQHGKSDGNGGFFTVKNPKSPESFPAFVEAHCGFSYSTAHRYCTLYLNIVARLPSLAGRMNTALLPGGCIPALGEDADLLSRLDGPTVAEFLEFSDPWSLSELYARTLKSANPADSADRREPPASKANREAAMIAFWLEDWRKRAESRTYLRLPPDRQRDILATAQRIVADLAPRLASATP